MNILLLSAVVAPGQSDWPSTGISGLRPFLAALFVVGLVAGCAWLLRRGRFAGVWRRQPQPVTVERAVPLGDRRSLAIVTVEGRRLLLGLTSVHVSLLAELERHPAEFKQALDRSLDAANGRAE